MNTRHEQTYPRSVMVRQITEELAKDLADVIERKTRTCVNCYHWRDDNETCGLTDNLRPPARVIVKGCDQHEDEIPF